MHWYPSEFEVIGHIDDEDVVEPIVDANGTKIYKNNKGQLHRLDGPAVEHADGSKEWWVNGKKVTPKDIITNNVQKRFDEDGYEYWLEQTKDNGLCLIKQCKTCKSLHPQVVRTIGERK